MKKWFKDRKKSKSFSGHKLNESSEPGCSSSGASWSQKGSDKVDRNKNLHRTGSVGNALPARKASGSGAGTSTESSMSSEILFKCPTLDAVSSLTRSQWRERIHEHLTMVKEADGVLSSILAIKSLNPPPEVDKTIKVISAYLKNLIDFPDNEKFKSIRMGNAIFKENILNVEGAMDFLSAVGFEKIMALGEIEEQYLVYKPDSRNNLKEMFESLLDINGIELQLDRDFQVINNKELSKFDQIPISDDFFELTSAEIKNEQLQRAKEIEDSKLLKTKKMRGLEKAHSFGKRPVYTRIRVRIPNELVIQGTFSVNEKLKNLRIFLDEKLDIDSTYTLMYPPSHVYNESDEDKTFVELDLQPAVNLILKTESKKISIKN